MRINRRGDRWNMELRKQNASNSDVKCFRCGCEFDFNENDIEWQRSLLLRQKRGTEINFEKHRKCEVGQAGNRA